jgi:hypothetical protein
MGPAAGDHPLPHWLTATDAHDDPLNSGDAPILVALVEVGDHGVDDEGDEENARHASQCPSPAP